MMAQPEAMIRYNCPRCQESLESPASFAGHKLNCPKCQQRMQIPQPSTPALPPPNKTMLAQESQAEPPPPSVRPRPQPQPEPLDVIEEAPRHSDREPSPRRDTCLECGRDLGDQQRVQTCGDCGSLLCSAGCYREHRYHAHPKRKKKQPAEFIECRHCGSTERPYSSSSISEGGWILFVVLLFLFFPLCWIGLLITEQRETCADCGARIR
jgi:DNA-directed RNA polymerase subunit RPC12/RpoP